ncbi:MULTISPECIES: hypothetical protein [Citrobacter]|uniref:hypothetical protein n=1 Tax=Citrobacter TaxID=544 RepID=UPI0015EAC515|nr:MULTISPECIES: hypothetical protein [Citrobacter]EHG7580632.1 hypothetical protein [Citrobacter sedlakii]EIQ7160246.1 hypothetical protein [Citrobacter sedlakii]MBN6597381.1 hypothetical protein [Citrobacter sedlakii]QMK47479.1 hypothetical protein HVX72_18160 [Citrobacter sp. RHB21-C05]QMK65923.1 hypothetical protein HVX68_18160 [Citrobacter sp. RHB21-C01]
MNNRQIRRVNLSLHLSPEHSRADLRAMLHLKKWHDDINQAGGNASDASMEVRRFHRNVYLAGLQLQMLNPQLCSHIAESIGRETLTLEALCAELSEGQLLPVAAAEPASAPQNCLEFSKQQLRQLRALMSDAMQRQPVVKEKDEGELAAMHDEIAQLKALLEKQHVLLQQLKMIARTTPAAESAKTSGAEEIDLSTLEAQTQKMKQIKQKGIF